MPVTYTTQKEAIAALCSHVCRKDPTLRLHPRHCEARQKKAAGKMTGTNPTVAGCSVFWYCRGCEGPVLKDVTPPPSTTEPRKPVAPPEPPKMKRCRGACKQEKPADLLHFYAHAKTADRLSGECKDCFRSRQRKYEQAKTAKKKRGKRK